MLKLARELQKAILSRAANKTTENLDIPITAWETELYLLNSTFLNDEK